MSAATLERERGDDRHSVELLQEMFSQPPAEEPVYKQYESDVPEVGLGDYAPVEVKHRNRSHQIPRQLGRAGLHRAHIRPSGY